MGLKWVGFDPRAFCVNGELSTTELHPPPNLGNGCSTIFILFKEYCLKKSLNIYSMDTN